MILRGYRAQAGFTQDELAEKAGMSVRGLRNLEAGKVQRPHPRSVERLAGALGLTGADMVRFLDFGEGTPEPGPKRLLPRQLPPDVPGFAGRGAELRTLGELVGSVSRTTPAVVVISGPAGVGKTALAVHWAHRLLDRYPDGQLYANLRGFDPVAPPVPPEDVVRAFLHALGEPVGNLPPGLDAQTALLRSLLADRRAVLLLDNVRDAAQVRPLLPGAGGCLVVVTSRNSLTGLVATAGARRLTVDVLSHSGARRILESRLGRSRVDAEESAAEDIIERCARLPLAMVVVAARAAAGTALATIATELRDVRQRLDALSSGDPEADVRAAIGWSYRALSPESAAVFRPLGLHPGTEVTAEFAASAAAVPLPAARAALAELTSAHLLTECFPGRFCAHDLLRAYAGELYEQYDEPARAATVSRMVDHYLQSLSAAVTLLCPYRDRSDLLAPAPGVVPVRLADVTAAQAWLAAERVTLFAVVDLAVRLGLDTHVGQMVRELTTYLDRRGSFKEVLRLGEAGLTAARRSGDRSAMAHSRRTIGRANAGLRRFEPARFALQEAVAGYGAIGQCADAARATLDLANVHGRVRRTAEALEHARAALTMFRAIGHRAGEAAALNTVGGYLTESGDHLAAVETCESALRIFAELGDRHGQALTWDSLGLAQHNLGRPGRAIECYRLAVQMHRESASEHFAADSEVHLGDAYAAAGDPEAARTAWRSALTALRRLELPEAAAVRQRLARLARRAGPDIAATAEGQAACVR